MLLLGFAFLCISLCFAQDCGDRTTCTECDVPDDSGGNACAWCVKTQTCVRNSELTCIFGDKIDKQSDCPKSVPDGYAYDDKFARTKMFAISAGAYYDPQPCLTNLLDDAKKRVQVTVPCDPTRTDRCSAFTAVSDVNKAMIIGFRGSDADIQLFLEGWETVLESKVNVPGGGMVSKYFYNAFDAVWKNGILQDFVRMAQENFGYELWISGHSLGAAMASIAADVIAKNGLYDGKRIKVVTFGEPRTGDHNFTIAHDSSLWYTYRVTHKRDMVAHLPSRAFRGYHHHRYEVWYNNDMKEGASYKLCTTPDDDACSDSNLVDLSIEDHVTYFGKPITFIGGKGCV